MGNSVTYFLTLCDRLDNLVSNGSALRGFGERQEFRERMHRWANRLRLLDAADGKKCPKCKSIVEKNVAGEGYWCTDSDCDWIGPL
jgi:hypothetical protein